MDGYEALANAIIIQAASDYRTARKVINSHPEGLAEDKYYKKAVKIRDECRDFFEGDWVSVLTRVDGKDILCALNKERV